MPAVRGAAGRRHFNMMAILKALLLLTLVGLNAFFVAAEYSLLRIRRTRLDELIEEGSAGARIIKHLLADTSLLFSGIQLGITVVSLLMGWLGERIVADALESLLAGRIHRYVSLAIANTVAVALAFLFVTVVLMVLGELVPKTFAYERAEQVALVVARPVALFFRLARLPVELLGSVSGRLMRSLRRGGLPPPGTLHTPEEVKLIVSAIREGGLLEEEQEEMIRGVFELDSVLVREVMVPWPTVVCLPATSTLEDVLVSVVTDQHTRVPIYDETPDHVLGILHTKDLLALLFDRQRRNVPLAAPFDLRSLVHQPMIVPETMSLAQMLEEARPTHAQMALVVDEFGTFVGMVTIEDVLEEVVGEIGEHHGREEPASEQVSDNVLRVEGTMTLRELADDYGIELPRGEGYETVGGFVLDKLGSVPRGGETFVFDNRVYSVVEMDRRRVALVQVEKIPDPSATPPRPVPQAPAPPVRGRPA